MNPLLNALRQAWAAWKRIAHKIGDFQVRVLLNVFYFVFLLPFALILRAVSDPLALKAESPRGWRCRESVPGTPAQRAARQF
jgi:hypothetical protein